ncbi:MAG: hypothetical protein N2484_00510 [Clostridia bacterium]|nr:hypothetical protein [Clostridia bacterium]
MDEQQAFNKINDLLDNTDYPTRITSIADIDDFLLDDDNRRFETYPVIGRIYDDLRKKPEVDRYMDVAVEKEGEQTKRTAH